MGKNTSAVWNGVTTENVFGGTTTFSLSEKIGALYPTTNSGQTREKIDNSFFNWTIGNAKYSTYQKVEGDSLQNIRFTDTKILHKIALVKNDTFDNSTVQPFNTISDCVSYSGKAIYQLSGDNIRIVNDFDYSDIYIYPLLTIRKFDKSTGSATNETNLTLNDLKTKQETFDTENFDYCIPYVTIAIRSRKQGGTAGLGNQYCIMSIIDLNDIQFICGFGKNGVFGYNEYRYNANLGGIYLNNNGGIKIKNQCYNVNSEVTYNKLETLGYNSYLKADYDTVMEYIASLGFWFYDGEIFYLPEIKNNQTTGKYFPENVLDYVDTENKNWTNTADIDNTIPKPGISDDIDDVVLGRDLYGNGFVNYFQVTAGNLTDISTAISNETEKIGIINNVISLKSYVVPTSAFLSAGSTVLAPIKLNGVTVLESAPKIVAHGMLYHIDDYTINGIYGNATSPHFLDKNPYTTIELYIPFCGIVTLPDKCMYNTISVDLLSDLFSGGCIGVVRCNGAIVAEKTGIIGYDVPLSAQNTAELSHALINNVMTSVNIGANTILSGATGNIGGIASGAMKGINNNVSMYHTANQNYTNIIGASGGRSDFALPPQCYIKICTKIANYPKNYLHTVGKPCHKTKKLSDCKGFTVCENVNVNVSATATEKQMIKQLLETGVYI